MGVLAMSRAIGDGYLKPYIIPDPEVVFVDLQKQDELIIIASDGLWDVVKDQEACDLARRKILQCYIKNNENLSMAPQCASDYLTKIALQRGSIDNISVIVVDLNPRRTFKKKSQCIVKAATVVAPKYTTVKPLADSVLVKNKDAEEQAKSKPQGGDIVGIIENDDVKDLKALNDGVLIKVSKVEQTTARGGLILTDSSEEKPSIGTIIAAGPGPLDEEGRESC